nr:PREDICTED: uncharacterized protein LOC106703222 [Latimeria chalumnae]|eukprot:XP_014343050.1 PREDICTED: uncharacterized protein LOC106703222 [Latimeria chalumnae]
MFLIILVFFFFFWKGMNVQQLCQSGLYCTICGTELLPNAEGHVMKAFSSKSEILQLERVVRNTNCTEFEPFCHCPSKVDQDLKTGMLVVESDAALKCLKETVKICQTTLASMDMQPNLFLNAIWNSEDRSITSYLHCKNCFSQALSPCSLVGAEITILRNKATSQVWLVPSSVSHCSLLHLPLNTSTKITE